MTPPQLHIHVEDELSTGYLPIITVGDPGVHGEEVTGIQSARYLFSSREKEVFTIKISIATQRKESMKERARSFLP